MKARKPFVGGNWKMNTSLASGSELVRGLADALSRVGAAEVAVFPPFPYLMAIGAILRDRHGLVRLGAQNVYHEPEGAFTGEVSVSMLQDCGVQIAMVGHSERRHVMGENDKLVNQKVKAVLATGMECVLCVGETLEQREAGQTHQVNERQVRAALTQVPEDHIARLTIAYEPVWAIGTGHTATPEDAQDAHARIRSVIEDLFGPRVAVPVRIIYGGSVKAANARSLFEQPDIDGGLIGGASLKISEFVSIVKSAAECASQSD